MSVNPLDLLDHGNYQTYNRKVARELGSVNAAIMLSELVNRYHYHRDREQLLFYPKFPGEWFYYTVEDCEKRTVLSRKEQETALKILEKHDLFEKRSIGMPATRHFQLKIDKILEFVGSVSNNCYSLSEKGEQERPKRDNKNVRNGRSHIYKNTSKEPERRQQQKKAPAAVVVPSCLEDLPVKDSLKLKLSKKYTPEQIEKACAAVQAMNPSNWDAAIQAALKEGWEPPQDKSATIAENVLYLRSIDVLDGKAIGHYIIEVFPSWVKFRGSAIDGSKDVIYKIDDRAMISKTKSFIQSQSSEFAKWI